MGVKVNKNFLNISGQWFEFPIEDNIALLVKIRPLFYDIGKQIENWNRKENQVDWAGLANDQLDFYLEDFRGVAYNHNPDTTIEVTFQAKRDLVDQVKGLLDFILLKAGELRKERLEKVIEFTMGWQILMTENCKGGKENGG